ncbi:MULTISPECIES: non-heme iron oxygenase ferredoxin subunit [Acidipropionibacterium]|uniref:non-heme iron oxygenase ferredoxin subunit n=1 Tax=Acidipropionibacterium TaxID=1912215 RepID=UPI00041589B4|nr:MULTISPECIES: non-heme iron oxygenase ferredoxin subunit [Acidipropionibacterium]
MAAVKVTTIDQLEDDTPAEFDEVEGTDIVLVRTQGQTFAIGALCSHAEVPMVEGEVEDCALECYMHGSMFDLRTGAPLSLPATEPIPVYPVTIDGDDVLVDVANPIPYKES